MIKTVTLKGSELKVEGLGGFNAFVQNLGSLVMYASKNPGVSAGGDNVAEIPAGSGKLISSTNGTVYLLGTGKAEVTGLDGDSVIAAGGAAVYGGGGASDSAVLAELMTYTDIGDEETLDAAKEYAEALVQNKADKSEIPEIPEFPTTLPANGGNADTVGGFTVGCDVPADAVFTDTVVDISGKRDANDPVITGTISMDRKANTTIGEGSVAIGYQCTASGKSAIAIGYLCKATGKRAFAEGAGSEASGYGDHAEGNHSIAAGGSDGGAHAEGGYTEALAMCAHAEGSSSRATGDCAHAQGCATIANGFASFAGGKFNKEMTPGSKNSNIGDVIVIGNGDLSSGRSNAFRITYTGEVYGVGAFNTGGADYAEFIKPWFDDNPEGEDRVGYFVTIKDGKLRFAEADDYIVGITSGNPSVVGNGDEDWLGRWQRDEFDRIITENGCFKANPDYDPSIKYVERKNRPEWDYVGMIGVLPLRDDGTCVPGGFAKCGVGGIATKADDWECHKTFFVIERVNECIIKVEMR
ncbi:MAG: hypothetical protein K2J77_04185 [Oscillospiraceae bacterium]|nr:hypothetical protein [Oscillospiraceae bacterium]